MDKSSREWFDFISKTINSKAKGRKIVCWGQDEVVVTEFEKRGVVFSEFFTGNSALINDRGWKSFSELKNNNDKYFVILPNNFRVKEAINTLEEYGFLRDDFFNISMLPKKLHGPLDKYNDDWGNTVKALPEKCSVFIGGNNNKIIFGNNCRVDNELEILCNSANNYIGFGNEVSFKGEKTKVHIIGKKGGVYVDIGDSCSFNRIKMDIGWGSRLLIGKKTTFACDTKFSMSANSSIKIGEDCMFSMDIILQPADGHSIFDLTTGKNINSDKNNFIDGYVKGIKLGNHVWVGKRSFILGGTDIKDGSVVGAQSTVKGHFPNNVALAGNPAKIRRQNIAWSRYFQAESIEKCNGYTDLTAD